MLTYFIETSQYKPTYRDSMPKNVTCLSTQLRLSHLFGMPYEDILSFVKGLDNYIIMPMSVEKFQGKLERITWDFGLNQMKPVWNVKAKIM